MFITLLAGVKLFLYILLLSDCQSVKPMKSASGQNRSLCNIKVSENVNHPIP